MSRGPYGGEGSAGYIEVQRFTKRVKRCACFTVSPNGQVTGWDSLARREACHIHGAVWSDTAILAMEDAFAAARNVARTILARQSPGSHPSLRGRAVPHDGTDGLVFE